jgi:SRSO17 transposase
VTEQQLCESDPALSDFLDRFLFCCGYTQTFAHLGTYVRGLLSDLPRKSVGAIAWRAGTPARTLQKFLTNHLWDFAAVRDQLQGHTAGLLRCLPRDELGTVGVIDEASVLRQGTRTPGVHRQYLGCVGKVTNGIVTVHLGVCKGRYQSLIDADLYLPRGWSGDRPRCREAGIPDEVVYRPRWQIALGQLDRARANGVYLDWLTFDEDYGKRPDFLAGLDQRQQPFVGEVPPSFSWLAARRPGRRPGGRVRGRPAAEAVRLSPAFRSQPWRLVRLPGRATPDQVWRVKAARGWLSGGEGWSAQAYRLVWARNDETGEEKFFFANAPPEARVETLVRVAFRRPEVGPRFRVGTSELGFGHFEGRSYVALLRHLSLGLVAMGFVAFHAGRLRGKMPPAADRPALPGLARAEPGSAAAATGDERAAVSAGHRRVPPGARPRRAGARAEGKK